MDKPIVQARPAAQRSRSWTDIRLVLWLPALCTILAGCAAGSKHATLPSDGPTMAEIYRQHMGAVNRPQDREPARQPAGGDISSFQREPVDDIDQRFVRLPNPDLVMYVVPHLSAHGKYPVPGYSTVFPMFETVHYALPGEVPWRRTAVAPASRPLAAATGSR